MNSPELAGAKAGSLDRPTEIAEQALQRYFHRETPGPWPEFVAPTTTHRTRFSSRSRWILVAAAVLLFLGPWLLASKFTAASKPGARSVIDVGNKPKLAPDR